MAPYISLESGLRRINREYLIRMGIPKTWAAAVVQQIAPPANPFEFVRNVHRQLFTLKHGRTQEQVNAAQPWIDPGAGPAQRVPQQVLVYP